ncbi:MULTISPECIES: hypothetical protein [unclassified Nostoc]|nr:hypothetical protein [Nostoc sp. JL23]MBN3875345.1 hypothetical protein [Nostoc sp. JL23]
MTLVTIKRSHQGCGVESAKLEKALRLSVVEAVDAIELEKAICNNTACKG